MIYRGRRDEFAGGPSKSQGRRWLEQNLWNFYPLFGWAYQHGLSAVERCFSLTANQPQPAYKLKKQSAEQGLSSV
jgi:hypothetical protein